MATALGIVAAIIGAIIFIVIGVSALTIMVGIKIAKLLLIAFLATVLIVSIILAIKVWGPKIRNRHF